MRIASSIVSAAAGGVVGLAAWVHAGGPPAIVIGAPAAGAGLATWGIAARRPVERARSVTIAVAAGAAVAAAVVVIAIGRPAASERDGVLAGVAGALVGAATFASLERRRRLTPGGAPSSRDAVDAVATRMTRAIPVDELLQQVVDVLRQTPQRRDVELWRERDGVLVLSNCAPLVDRDPVVLGDTIATGSDRTSVNGGAWLRTWFPQLASDVDDTGLERVAPLTTHGELLGLIVLRRSPDDPPFGPAEDDRLARVQRPLAIALNQARLYEALEASVDELHRRNDELQASRARLVSVADAERRRLERDLHDGAQAQLTALGVKLQLARAFAARDPDRTSELLTALEDDVAAASDELRRLSHGIVPPLLVTDGLGDALRVAASRSPVEVTVEAVPHRRFPAPIEAAVYFCITEALQNVAKHGGPGARATVRLVLESDRLTFEVVDDGTGASGPVHGTGQGVVNMTDRIGALGGTIEVGPAKGVGFRVRGQIPFDGGPTAEDSAR